MCPSLVDTHLLFSIYSTLARHSDRIIVTRSLLIPWFFRRHTSRAASRVAILIPLTTQLSHSTRTLRLRSLCQPPLILFNLLTLPRDSPLETASGTLRVFCHLEAPNRTSIFARLRDIPILQDVQLRPRAWPKFRLGVER